MARGRIAPACRMDFLHRFRRTRSGVGQAPPPLVASEEDGRARRSNASKKSNVYCSRIKYLSKTVVSCFLRIARCASQDDSDWVRSRTACPWHRGETKMSPKTTSGRPKRKKRRRKVCPKGGQASRRDPTLTRTLFGGFTAISHQKKTRGRDRQTVADR